jgi:hypothetical protein
MHALSIIALIVTFIGSIWFAYEVWQREEILWALAVFFIPFPLLGLYIYYRAGWDSCYRNPALVYVLGYTLILIAGRG